METSDDAYRTYYEYLGVSVDATIEDIQLAINLKLSQLEENITSANKLKEDTKTAHEAFAYEDLDIVDKTQDFLTVKTKEEAEVTMIAIRDETLPDILRCSKKYFDYIVVGYQETSCCNCLTSCVRLPPRLCYNWTNVVEEQEDIVDVIKKKMKIWDENGFSEACTKELLQEWQKYVSFLTRLFNENRKKFKRYKKKRELRYLQEEPKNILQREQTIKDKETTFMLTKLLSETESAKVDTVKKTLDNIEKILLDDSLRINYNDFINSKYHIGNTLITAIELKRLSDKEDANRQKIETIIQKMTTFIDKYKPGVEKYRHPTKPRETSKYLEVYNSAMTSLETNKELVIFQSFKNTLQQGIETLHAAKQTVHVCSHSKRKQPINHNERLIFYSLLKDLLADSQSINKETIYSTVTQEIADVA